MCLACGGCFRSGIARSTPCCLQLWSYGGFSGALLAGVFPCLADCLCPCCLWLVCCVALIGEHSCATCPFCVACLCVSGVLPGRCAPLVRIAPHNSPSPSPPPLCPGACWLLFCLAVAVLLQTCTQTCAHCDELAPRAGSSLLAWRESSTTPRWGPVCNILFCSEICAFLSP